MNHLNTSTSISTSHKADDYLLLLLQWTVKEKIILRFVAAGLLYSILLIHRKLPFSRVYSGTIKMFREEENLPKPSFKHHKLSPWCV